MDHSQAIEIFKEIQARPYQVSTEYDVPANNCYFKGIELMQKLAVLGYTVRGRIAETYWDDKVIPKEILSLTPKDYEVTHIVTEIEIDGEWRFLDPSYQLDLGKHGLTTGSWENGQSCFPITKLFSQEESITYQKLWSGEDKIKAYFKNCFDFHTALNKWFASRT